MAKKKTAKGVFSADEKAAMKERARELKAAASKEGAEKELHARIAEMPPPDRALANRIHDIVTKAAPELASKTWYGMPAYAKDGDVICFFQSAAKFKYRYATLGFSDKAKIDDGEMFPIYFALKKLTKADEARITALVKKAVS